MSRIKSILPVVLLLACSQIRAQGLWEKDASRQLCGQLGPVSQERLSREMGVYGSVMAARDGLVHGQLRAFRFEHMRPLLQQAAERGWGILEVFTQPEFADPDGCALFLDGATLAEIHRAFDLHGLWQIEAKLAGTNGAMLRMSYLIVGRGRLIIGYPRKATITIADDDAVTGDYDYAPYFSSRIDGSHGGRGLSDIRTLTSPDGEFEPFVGPYGVHIYGLQMTGREILVKYAWGIGQERRARSVPISLRSHVATSP